MMNTAVKLALGMVALTFVALLGLQTMASRAPKAEASAVSLPVADEPVAAAPDASVESPDGPNGAGSGNADLTIEGFQREYGQSDAAVAEAARKMQVGMEQSANAKSDTPNSGVSFEPGAPMVDPTPQ